MSSHLKHLISIFLVVSLFSATGMLLLSRHISKLGSARVAGSHVIPSENLRDPSLSRVGGNVSLGADDDVYPPYYNDLDTPRKKNYTKEFAGMVAKKIIAANPKGPVYGEDDLEILFPGGLNRSAVSYIEELEINESIPELLGVDVDELNISVVDDSEGIDLSNYVASLTTAFDDARSQMDSINEASLAGDFEAVQQQSQAFNMLSALESDLYSAEVPSSFEGYHRTLLGMSQANRKYLDLANTDPFLAGAAYSKMQDFTADSINKMREEFLQVTPEEGVGLIGFMTEDEEGSLSQLVHQLLGIETAHAVFSGIVPVFDPPNFGEMLGEWFLQMVLEAIKGVFLTMMVGEIMEWAVGDGSSPTFVTNWKLFLKNTVDVVSGAVIEDLAPELCEPFQDISVVLLTPTISVGQTAVDTVSCTLSDVIDNFDDFYEDFDDGGWMAYGSFMQMENNVIGSLINFKGIRNQETKKSKEDRTKDAESGQGTPGIKWCDDESTPGIGGLCFDGSFPDITAPGFNVTNYVQQGIDISVERIMAASNWQEAVGAFASFALSVLIAKGSQGLIPNN